MFIWMPSCAAGPENAADWPSTIEREVTPGVCAGTAAANRSVNVPSKVRMTHLLCRAAAPQPASRDAVSFRSAYCGSQQDISRVHTRPCSPFAGCAAWRAVAFATTTGFALAWTSAFFSICSAARAAETNKHPSTTIVVRMAQTSRLSVQSQLRRSRASRIANPRDYRMTSSEQESGHERKAWKLNPILRRNGGTHTHRNNRASEKPREALPRRQPCYD